MFRAEVLTPNGLVNATGYFGPSSRAKANDLCIADATTGEVDDAEDATEDEDEDADVTLQGTGTLETFEIDDAEDRVEEGAEDEVVLEVTAEAENGDLEIARLVMQLVANEGNEEIEPWDTFDEVSIWIDGDKVASFDASDEDDYLDEDNGTFQFTNLGIILMEDEEVEMLVAVSVQNSVDGADADLAEWNIDILEARTFDADGVAETNNFDEMGDKYPLGLVDTFAEITDGINFDIVAEGVDDDASIESDSNSPDSATLKVEDNRSESEEYLVHTFEIEVDDESSDLLLEDAYVWVSITNPAGGVASIDSTDVVAEITLTIDGQTETGDAVVNENAAIANGATVRVGYRFQFDGLDLDADETYIAAVNMTFEGADVNADPTLSAYDPGTGITTDVDAQEAGARWEVEGQDNDFVLTGTDESEDHALNTVVPVISGVSVTESVNDSRDAGSVSFRFSVEADGEDDIAHFTIANIVAAVSGGIINPTPVLVKTGGDATTNGAGDFTILDGDEASFALTFTFPATVDGNGTYFVNLDTVLGVEVDETSNGLDITGN